MTRLISTVLVMGGVALLTTRLISPAASDPSPQAVSSTPAPTAVVRDAEAVDAEVGRLQERSKALAPYASPARDPFRFGARTERRPAAPPSDAPRAPDPDASARLPSVVFPALVAIIADSTDGQSSYRAAFAVGDGIEFVSATATLGNFVVQSIGPDAVRLRDVASGRLYDVPLQ